MDPQNFDTQNLSEDQQRQVLFMMLVQQHNQIAMMGMGKLKNPSTDKIERDMNAARFAIDTLLMLQKYTEGNLTDELANYLQETLTNLRLNYADEMKKGDPDPAEPSVDSNKKDIAGNNEDESSEKNDQS